MELPGAAHKDNNSPSVGTLLAWFLKGLCSPTSLRSKRTWGYHHLWKSSHYGWERDFKGDVGAGRKALLPFKEHISEKVPPARGQIKQSNRNFLQAKQILWKPGWLHAASLKSMTNRIMVEARKIVLSKKWLLAWPIYRRRSLFVLPPG